MEKNELKRRVEEGEKISATIVIGVEKQHQENEFSGGNAAQLQKQTKKSKLQNDLVNKQMKI